MEATATARPNIALVKYWGKRDARLNLPAAGSLSITLDALSTRTRVCFDPALDADRVRFNGGEDATASRRITTFLDLLRDRAATHCRASVDTSNNFPTAAGLASSASGFAALAMAASKALGLPVDGHTLSALARQGSGSAARSIYGGFVIMRAGTRVDGCDAVAEPLAGPNHWPLAVVIAVTTHGAKPVGSGDGMERTRATSPFHQAWLASIDRDLLVARAAIDARDFGALAEVSEHSCLKMHADMLAAQPPLMYWSATTLACIECVRRLRERDGVHVFFTIDAGPQVKAVCLPDDAARVGSALAAVPGVLRVIPSRLGAGAECVEDAGAGER